MKRDSVSVVLAAGLAMIILPVLDALGVAEPVKLGATIGIGLTLFGVHTLIGFFIEDLAKAISRELNAKSEAENTAETTRR